MTSTKRYIPGIVLNVCGYVLFALGAIYTLASHDLHDRLPFFAGLPHDTHTWIGAVTIVIGAGLLIVADKLTKRARKAAVVANA
jgi:hypothetical protein